MRTVRFALWVCLLGSIAILSPLWVAVPSALADGNGATTHLFKTTHQTTFTTSLSPSSRNACTLQRTYFLQKSLQWKPVHLSTDGTETELARARLSLLEYSCFLISPVCQPNQT